MRNVGGACLMLLVMPLYSAVIVYTCRSATEGGPYGWIVALVAAVNIWCFRFVFAAEESSQWPARGSRGTRLALNAALLALVIQNPQVFAWIHPRLHPGLPQVVMDAGWILLLGLPIFAVAFSVRALFAQVRYKGKYVVTAALASVLSGWAVLSAFRIIRVAAEVS